MPGAEKWYNTGMAGLKQIMYGVTDFALMRAENAYFVDRTDLIRELEKTHYTVFLRPRRFGKSLLVSILQCYYDVDYAHRFDELFGGLKIAANPTDERVALDIHYILNWSPWMGLFIVYRMIAAVCLMMGSC